jgi:(R,R)-butanediol dehydrogenase/meso-butanediol dehydrogenase/diacetyl reductase
VVAVDVEETRLEAAKMLGASETVLVEPDLDGPRLRALLPDDVPVVIESSGAPGAAQRACDVVARGGTVLLVGLVKAAQPMTLSDVVLREVTLQTTVAHVCASDLPEALSLLTQRPLASLLVARTVLLPDVVTQGLEPLSSGVIHGKVIVDPRRG